VSFAECFWVFSECPRHLIKLLDPVVPPLLLPRRRPRIRPGRPLLSLSSPDPAAVPSSPSLPRRGGWWRGGGGRWWLVAAAVKPGSEGETEGVNLGRGAGEGRRRGDRRRPVETGQWWLFLFFLAGGDRPVVAFFFEKNVCQVYFGHSAKSLPSVRQKTLGKLAFAVKGFAECF